MQTGPLRILADANIPFADAAFSRYGAVRLAPGRAIDRAAAAEADVLLVRSVTPVGAALVAGTPVRFVGTATAGVDHVAQGELAALGVAFAAAPGSNADSVADWAVASLLALAAKRGEALAGRTLGVVGVGAVGSRVAPRARALGMRVVASDPPLAARRAAAGAAHGLVPFEAVLAEADALTLHTPLTRAGESAHPTARFVDAGALARLRRGAWVLNAARGGVVDGAALAAALDAGHVAAAALDVWEGEPAPDPGLVARVDLASAHTAGYAFDGKVRGTAMLQAALRRWLAAGGHALPAPWDPEAVLAPAAPLVAEPPPPPDTGSGPGQALDPAAAAAWLDALARQACDVRADDARFRAALAGAPDRDAWAAAFAELRRTYPRRREMARYAVGAAVPEALAPAVSDGLGMGGGMGDAAP